MNNLGDLIAKAILYYFLIPAIIAGILGNIYIIYLVIGVLIEIYL